MKKCSILLGTLPFLLTINSSFSICNLNPFEWFRSKKTIHSPEKLEKAYADLVETVETIVVYYIKELELLVNCSIPSQKDEAELLKALKNIQIKVIEHIMSKKPTVTEESDIGVETIKFPYLTYFKKLSYDINLLEKVLEYYKKQARKNNKNVNNTFVVSADTLFNNLKLLSILVLDSNELLDELPKYSNS